MSETNQTIALHAISNAQYTHTHTLARLIKTLSSRALLLNDFFPTPDKSSPPQIKFDLTKFSHAEKRAEIYCINLLKSRFRFACVFAASLEFRTFRPGARLSLQKKTLIFFASHEDNPGVGDAEVQGWVWGVSCFRNPEKYPLQWI